MAKENAKEPAQEPVVPAQDNEIKAEAVSAAQEPAAEPADPMAELQQQLDRQKDLLLRTAAEYDNYKKRTQKEKDELSHYTTCSLLKALLPALDNFDRAASAGDDNPAEYKKGMDMSIKMLADILEKLGLREIACDGAAFDPNFHYAVSKIEDETLGENVIAQVYQKGYQFGDTVIRPAMVVVANCS